jgi:Fe-S cluster assembly protein SufD
MKNQLVDLEKNDKIDVVEDSLFVLLAPEYSSAKKYSLTLAFPTANVSAEVYGLFALRGVQQLDLEIRSSHYSSDTVCNVDIRTALLDTTSASFRGLITVAKDACGTVSNLSHKTVVMGNGTVNVSQPELQISNNNVQVSHASTTGRISQKDLYYLTGRGLSVEQAEAVILEGFFQELLDKISTGRIVQRVSESLGIFDA